MLSIAQSFYLHLSLQGISGHKHSTQVTGNGLIEKRERYTVISFSFLYSVQHLIIMNKNNTICVPVDTKYKHGARNHHMQ